MSSFRLKLIAIFLVAHFFSVALQAQNNPYNEVSIASPTAASLGKYADIPVSYHTGIPQINIPLYTATAGSLSLPISLSYHASGLKVMEPAGWVGAGWALNAGGVITRTVRGAPDERGTSNLGASQSQPNGDNKGYFSDYGYQSYSFVDAGAAGLSFLNGMTPDDQDLGNGTIDGEPDLFFFNFGSYSGKFYFRDDRTPVLVPEEDFKIVPSYTGTGSIQSFVITTPDGVKYSFGKTASTTDVDPIEITNPYNGQSGLTEGTVISSWFLNKISTADDEFSINLSYTAENYSYYTISMFPLDGNDVTGKREYNLIKDYVHGVRLSQISFPNGTVTFSAGAIRQDLSDDNTNGSTLTESANSQATSLGSVQITNTGSSCKKFNFYYSYFQDNSTPLPGNFSDYGSFQTDKKRLRLDSLAEQSCDASLRIPPYVFSYMSLSENNTFAPRRLNFGQDHWGFYNGAANGSLIPAYTLNNFAPVGGANRDASWPEMSYGSLYKITYPTGGSDQFEFEANDTWLSYPVYTDVYANSAGVGSHIGQGSTATITQTFSSNPYRFTLDFNSTSSNSGASAAFAGLSVNRTNPHAEIVFQPGAGSHSYVLAINGSTSADWAIANIYEEVTSQFTGNVPVGGLRVKTITRKDAITANDIMTSYTYQTNGVSNGVLYSRPTYVQVIRSDLFKQYGESGQYDNSSSNTCNPNGCLSCDASTSLAYLKSPSPLRPMNNTQGNHIGYNEVKVSQSGNGYSIYRYYGSNFWDINHDDVAYRNANTKPPCDASIPNFPEAPLPYEYTRGELKYEGHFNESGTILKEATYYPVYQDDPVTTPGVVASTTMGPQPMITPYELVSGRQTQMTVISRDYGLSGTNVTKIDSTFYGSPYHHQVTRQVTLNSKGEKLEKKMNDAFDFRIASCDTIADGSQSYATAAASAVSQLNSSLFTCTTMGCRWIAFQTYRYNLSQARINYVSTRRNKYMDPGNAFDACHINAKTNADAELKPILELQDEFRNPEIETSNWKNGNLLHAGFNRYDFVTNPSNIAYPTKLQLINLAAPTGSLTGATTNSTSTSVIKDSRYLDEAQYGFNLGNLTQVIPHNGVADSYIWDYNNSLPIAKVLKTSPDQLAYTSFEADGSGNWTLGSATRDTTNSFTGTKSYNLNSDISRSGLTSATTYIVSYWTRNTSPFTITGTISGFPVKGKTISYNNTNWTLYTHRVTGQTTISISGSGSIDELRLYPLGAQMTTYTYTPLVGMTSQTDMGNRVTYYEYDGLQRLMRVRDQDHNILKSLEYQYQVSSGCGPNCYSITMQTLAGTNTLGYPVGVFDVHGNLLGNATGPVQYVSLWNADTANARIGTLSTGADSLHFSMTLNSGMTLPTGVTGCRYYQFDLPWNLLDGVRNRNGAYVDFGDGEGMHLAKGISIPAVLTPHTTVITNNTTYMYLVHAYTDTILKTITIYHDDSVEDCWLDNVTGPAYSLAKLRNFRGNVPQQMQIYGFSSYQQASALTVTNLANWNSINSITEFDVNDGDGDKTPCKNMSFAQDFMQNNRNLQAIRVSGGGYHFAGYEDTTFKISRLKSDWNTYFTNLQTLSISDQQWNREDLTALTKLSSILLVAGTTDHDANYLNPPIPVPIPTAVLDSVINQIAAGAGQFVSNGVINLITGGTSPTAASSTAAAQLIAKGWSIYVNW